MLIVDWKSTSGNVFKVFGKTVSLSLRKQATVCLLSTEAKYISLCQISSEAIWLRNLLCELGVTLNTTIYEEIKYQSCIKIAEEPRVHKRRKQIDVKYNFNRKTIANNISSNDQITEYFIMTKGL